MEARHVQVKELGNIMLEGFTKNELINLDKIKALFICVGQGGGRIREELYRIGFRVLLANTSPEALRSVTKVPDKYKILLEGYHRR